MTDDEFTESLQAAFADHYDVDAETATRAASGAAGFREDATEDLTVEDLLDRVGDAPYDDFRHRFNWAIGDLSATDEDRPDTKSFRLTGFDSLSGERAAR